MTEDQKRDLVDMKLKVAVMSESLSTVKDDVKDIKGHLTKLIWLLVTAIVLAFMQWILKGGLKDVI